MREKPKPEFTGLIDALAMCPVCGVIHGVRVNPLYMPPIHKAIPGKWRTKPLARDMTPQCKAERFYFRVRCDKCMAVGVSQQMREELRKKGWNI